MKTKEEIIAEKGIRFPANRSPRDYNLTLMAMDEYANQQVKMAIELFVNDDYAVYKTADELMSNFKKQYEYKH